MALRRRAGLGRISVGAVGGGGHIEHLNDGQTRVSRIGGRRRAVIRRLTVLAPEGGKRRVEHTDVIVVRDEERPARLIHIVARGEVYVLERFNEIDDAAGQNGNAHSPQDAAEHQQVLEKAGHEG